jgi:hypothetical protein
MPKTGKMKRLREREMRKQKLIKERTTTNKLRMEMNQLAKDI